MASTVSIDELTKHASNIYEAIVVIAKRARQISDDQKRYLEQELGFEDILGSRADDVEETDEYREDKSSPRKVIKLPKPPSVSLEELLADKLDYKYAPTPMERD